MTLAGWLNPVVTNNTLINSPLYTELSQTGHDLLTNKKLILLSEKKNIYIR